MTIIAGVDEAGRGPWAGPVTAAAVILNPQLPIEGLNDSKALSAKKREALYPEIISKALAWGVAYATVEEIDRLNILQASLLAMQRAVMMLTIAPQKILVDGNHCPKLDCPAQAIVGGDALVAEISAASIIAKVTRDLEMQRLDTLYPGYGFGQHKGYGTKVHQLALRELGVSVIHRRSFAPIKLELLRAESQEEICV